MAAAVPMLDDIIKEYLVFRGFSNTLKSFESDLKADKDKSFRVGYHVIAYFAALRTTAIRVADKFKKSCCIFCSVFFKKRIYLFMSPRIARKIVLRAARKSIPCNFVIKF